MQSQSNGASASFVPFQPGQSALDFMRNAPGMRGQSTTSSAGSKLVFRDTEFDIVDRDGKPWLRGLQIGGALGYERPDHAIWKLYEKHNDEFTDNMTTVVTLSTNGGDQQVRIFSLRGAHLLGMFARTDRAAEFRHWVLDVLDREVDRPESQQRPMLDIFATGRWLADVNESGWPQLTRIPDDAVFAFPEDPASMAQLVDDLPIDVVPAVLNAAAARLTGASTPKLGSPRKSVKKPSIETPLQRLVRYVRNAKKYARDRKYTDVLRLGMMPYAKALKLMAINADDLRLLVCDGIETGVLVLRRVPEYSGEVIEAV